MYIYEVTTTNNHLQFYYKAGGSSITINTGELSVSTWYFVEIAWNNTGNEYKLFIDGVQQGATNTTNLPDWDGTGGTNILQLGDSAGTNADHYSDQLFISNDPTRDLNAIKDCTNCNP
jgi:hypothetical protein